MDVLRRAEREIANGRLWRAREILENSVRHSGYKARVYEKLGIVLLEMRDLAEAGKYLFLSGACKPDYEEAIDIFFKKYENKPHNLFRSFPNSAKLSRISDYPKPIADKLCELSLPEELKDEMGNSVIYSDSDNSGRFKLIACFTIVFLVLALLVLGIVKLFEIIF
jgi:tetratricopeptide (TPR) repeat protein